MILLTLLEWAKFFCFIELRKFLNFSIIKSKVMSTAELKIDLINQITVIKDKVRLKELLQLIKFQEDSSVYITNDDEKKAILEARNEIKNGEFSSDDDVRKEINEWLKK